MLKKTIVLFAVAVCTAAGVAQTTPVACSAISLGNNGALNGFVPSPNDAWHQDISNASLDPNSNKIITTAGDLAGASLHPDFSSIAGGNYGIPYTVVDGKTTPGVPVTMIAYPTESDQTVYPIPTVMPIEGAPAECPTDTNDRHAIVIDRNGCVAYEMYQAAHCSAGWTASQGTLWDFTTTEKRPYGMTSTDAAGLSVFEGLVRYDEIVAGQINHAIRFTAQHTKADAANGLFVAPATHAAGNLWGTDNIIGMRIRLKASFDISGFSSTNQVILKAMKQYGMILADNGSNMYFQGTPDARWNDSDLNKLKVVPSSAFEVVQMGTAYDANTAPTGAKPVITSFTASATTVSPGASVTLTPVVTGGSYGYIDVVGAVRGAVTVNPTATTTYTLTSRNAFGTATASVKVTVSNAVTTPTLTFAAVGSKVYGTAAFAVSATSASTGAVTYSVASGPATVSGSTVTLTGVGTVVLQASQAATTTYNATTATTSFAVTAGDPVLAFVAIPAHTVGDAAFTVATTTKSSGSISYAVVSGPATVSGNSVTVTGAGTVTLQASEAAAGNYAAATATASFAVATAAATPGALTFAPIGPQTFPEAAFAVTATSASPAAITYTMTGPGWISGNSVTLVGTGMVTVFASQPASGKYAAGNASASFVVTATPAGTLVLSAIGPQTFPSAAIGFSATSQSPAPITYQLTGPGYISGNTVVLTGTGTVMLRASQAAIAGFGAATVTSTFAVTATPPGTLVWTPIPTQTLPGKAVLLTVSSQSPAPITFTMSGPGYLAGNTVVPTGAGTITVRALQAATAGYTAATLVTTFAVVAK